jgi:hypothetical protein
LAGSDSRPSGLEPCGWTRGNGAKPRFGTCVAAAHGFGRGTPARQHLLVEYGHRAMVDSVYRPRWVFSSLDAMGLFVIRS